jgi:uncharacterized protein YyaL (SSP411 family)
LLLSLEHSHDLRAPFETFPQVGHPTSMNRRTKSSLTPLVTAIAVAFASVMAIAAAPGRASTQNHLPAGQSAFLDRARGERVDWYPWGNEAFREARERNQPILLDLGATWCPWCKLMERESYNDAETAGFIASHFVAVKVDYDADSKLSAELERAQAFINLPAGLPLTAFLTPDGVLYFGGGYFPRKAATDKPAFHQALEQASDMFRSRRAEIERDGFEMKIGE